MIKIVQDVNEANMIISELSEDPHNHDIRMVEVGGQLKVIWKVRNTLTEPPFKNY